MIIIAHDNLDKEQGFYFSECAEEIKNSLAEPLSKNLIELSGEQLNATNLDLRLFQINHSGFIFCAFSHGTQKSLNARNVAYLECGVNSVNLKRGLTYTNACLAGEQLGLEIVDKGGKTFVGYKDEVESILAEDYRKISVRCDNYAMILFLNGYSIREAINSAKEHFSIEIDKLVDSNSLLFASILRGNRDSLIVYGDQDLSLAKLLEA